VPVDAAEIDRPARPATTAEHIEPPRASEQHRPDGRPQHVPAEGELVVSSLDDGVGLGARCLVGSTFCGPSSKRRA
jgi:hypothetical protein